MTFRLAILQSLYSGILIITQHVCNITCDQNMPYNILINKLNMLINKLKVLVLESD